MNQVFNSTCSTGEQVEPGDTAEVMSSLLERQLADLDSDPDLQSTAAAVGMEVTHLTSGLRWLAEQGGVTDLDALDDRVGESTLAGLCQAAVSARNRCAPRSTLSTCRFLRLVLNADEQHVRLTQAGRICAGVIVAPEFRAQLEAAEIELSRHLCGQCFRCSAPLLRTGIEGNYTLDCAADARHLCVDFKWLTEEKSRLVWAWAEGGAMHCATVERDRDFRVQTEDYEVQNGKQARCSTTGEH